MKHYNIRVLGKVQGVYFRASTKMEAERLGINGFVQNEVDGSVYIEAEGSTEQLKQLLAWCKIGSPISEVESVRFEETTVVDFQMFEIRRTRSG
ncbi:MAG: acylphosphatase [Bacteroidota bacterium]